MWIKNTILSEEQRLRSTFHGRQIIYGQFQTLAPPEHTYSVPLIIVQILTRKNSLWTFACRTVQTAVNTHACKHTAYITDRLRDREGAERKEDRVDELSSLTEAENIKVNIVNGPEKNTSFWLAFAVLIAPLDRSHFSLNAIFLKPGGGGRRWSGCHISIYDICFAVLCVNKGGIIRFQLRLFITASLSSLFFFFFFPSYHATWWQQITAEMPGRSKAL